MSVADVVVRRDGEAVTVQKAGEGVVAQGVFRHAVRDLQHRAHLRFARSHGHHAAVPVQLAQAQGHGAGLQHGFSLEIEETFL